MENSKIYIAMPDVALPIALPNGWTIAKESDPLTLVARI
jgi:hypothetical protein